jgi:hypothetical protein
MISKPNILSFIFVQTAAMMACVNGKSKVLKFLMNDRNANVEIHDNKGYDCLDAAAMQVILAFLDKE